MYREREREKPATIFLISRVLFSSMFAKSGSTLVLLTPLKARKSAVS